MKHESEPFGYSIANRLIFKKVKAAMGLENVNYSIYGAAALKQSTVDYLASIDLVLFNTYGLSETSGPTTF